MARLTRATQKIFAGNATNNGVFGSLQAGSGQLSNDVETIQSLPAYEQGWNAATISSELLPPLEEFQGVQYANSYQLAYIFQEGVPEWDAETTYYKGSVVKVVSGNVLKLYHSIVDDNIGNDVSDGSSWFLDIDTSQPFQLITNLSQTIDSSTTKYPSNNAVQTAINAIDVNADIKSFISTVYPIGSLFFSTASTCPLQSLGIGTWSKVGTSLTLNVNTSVPVKGNGLTLGLTSGSKNYGFQQRYTSNFGSYASTSNNTYGTTVGTENNTGFEPINRTMGLTTDASKSGVVGTVTRTQITVNVFQRTA